MEASSRGTVESRIAILKDIVTAVSSADRNLQRSRLTHDFACDVSHGVAEIHKSTVVPMQLVLVGRITGLQVMLSELAFDFAALLLAFAALIFATLSFAFAALVFATLPSLTSDSAVTFNLALNFADHVVQSHALILLEGVHVLDYYALYAEA